MVHRRPQLYVIHNCGRIIKKLNALPDQKTYIHISAQRNVLKNHPQHIGGSIEAFCYDSGGYYSSASHFSATVTGTVGDSLVIVHMGSKLHSDITLS